MALNQARDDLKRGLSQHQLAFPGTDAYNVSNDCYLSIRMSELTPAAIVQPESPDDFVSFLRIIKKHDAPFAIRGGGQQPLEVCSNIENGVTLDLTLMNSIDLKKGGGVVAVGAGARWASVYEKVEAEGLGVGGSRSGKGGIGGFSLSGGLSFFSTREGLICDNVINYQVVIASGEIVQANAVENADLWRALKGGGNNFGVVTRFDLRTFQQGPFWGGFIFYAVEDDNYNRQVEAMVNELRKPDPSDGTHVLVTLGYSK